MSKTKEHSVMGFSRASGKRRWSGDYDDLEPPSKAVCTSPLSFTLQTAHPIAAVVPSEPVECSSHSTKNIGHRDTFECSSPMEDSDCEESTQDLHASDEDDSFIDDEEDKDSGFVDGNSIDNSSDEELEEKGDSFSLTASSSTEKDSSELQLNLSKALDNSSSSIHEEDTLLPPNSCCPTSTTAISFSGSISECKTVSSSVADVEKRETSLTTVTATQTGTHVTSAYQGSVPTPTYDLHSYQTSTFTSDLYQPRPCAPSWSCTFYDASQPTTTNKYMEISPDRSTTSQSIQCDENGKSYLELGSASPYTNSYSAECPNFTPGTGTGTGTPSSYHGSSYSQPSYSPNNTYFNGRQTYSSAPYNYHNSGEAPYNGYDGIGGCSYGYINGTFIPPRGGATNRLQRCSSPSCDPTRTKPRAVCYQQQRLSVLNMSMFKLNRFSRFPEPSLHRSVLICNTLKHIEKEMEAEGVSMTAILAQSHGYGHGIMSASAPPAETMPSMPSSSTATPPLPSLHPPMASPSTCSTVSSPHFELPYPPVTAVDDHTLSFESRPTFSPSPNRAALVTSEEPMEEEATTSSSSAISRTSSTLTEEKSSEGGINWCSVLSLSSQTDLDSMNNNECNEWNNETISSRSSEPSTSQPSVNEETVPAWKLPSLSADDVLKTFPEIPRRQDEELDSIIKVLVSS